MTNTEGVIFYADKYHVTALWELVARPCLLTLAKGKQSAFSTKYYQHKLRIPSQPLHNASVWEILLQLSIRLWWLGIWIRLWT
jgi:hypothetical protein